MSYLSPLFLFLWLILVVAPSYAKEQLIHNSSTHNLTHEISSINGIKLVTESKPLMLVANKTVTIRFRLFKNNKPLTQNDLKEVHTKKIHILIINQSLTDYHHIHPVADNKTQDFVFNFTPKNNGSYRMWVDITLPTTNKQEFLVTDLGAPSKEHIFIEKKLQLNSSMEPYKFALKLDSEPKAGQEIMATIAIMKNGKPFTQLEPVMGAFAHVVGFSADYPSVLHIHPMGTAPYTSADRGGPELMFHMKLKESGFVKLFAQFRINEKDIYIPFGVFVK